jgi:hypothetical protein
MLDISPRHRARGIALLGAIAAGGLLATGPAAHATTPTCTGATSISDTQCSFGNGGTFTFVVPAGVASLDVQASGADGGSGRIGNGGPGSSVQDTAVSVTPGQSLTVIVGGAGGAGSFSSGGGAGGSPGNGGAGGISTGGSSNLSGGGGGGFSGVLDASSGHALVIAAGGGGAGGQGAGGNGDVGSGGGRGGIGNNGSSGGFGAVTAGNTCGLGDGGIGPDQAPGNFDEADGGDGSSLTGGVGGSSSADVGVPGAHSGGGGGGGGFCGGGGGGGGNSSAGGGGGSSFGAGPGLTNETAATSAQVTINFVVSIPLSATIDSPTGKVTAKFGQAVPTSFHCTGQASCVDSNAATSGQGTLNTGTLGKHSYTVTATGSDSSTQTASLAYTVLTAPTGTKMVCAPLALTGGQSSSCTVTVRNSASGATIAPAGTVTLSDKLDGLSADSCELAPSAAGSATCSFTDTPPAGSDTITAKYLATTGLGSSTGKATVKTTDVTSTALVCTPDPVTAGQPATCTATVTDTAPVPAGPTGKITFTGTGGALSAKSCVLIADGDGTSSCTITDTPAGKPGKTTSATLNAAYGGSPTERKSNQKITLTVNG